jgi:hypothetical protein
MQKNMMVNQRQFFRLVLDPPLCADMTIVRVNGKTLETGSARVLIVDLGAGGLRFQSTLHLPVTPHVVLELVTEVLGQPLKMIGCIVRNQALEGPLMEYGMQFTMDEEKIADFSRLTNMLAIRLRQKGVLPSGRFLEGEKLAYLGHS